MKEYLLSIIGTVLLSAFLTAILPDGKTSGIIRAITRLACTLAIVAPVLQFVQSGDFTFYKIEETETIFSQSVIDHDVAFIHYYSELRIRETENALAQELEKTQGIKASISIEWRKENEGIYIEKIIVKSVEQQDEEAARRRWEYLTKNYCSEVLIE